MIELRLQEPVRYRSRPDLRFDRHYQRELERGVNDPKYKPIGLDDEARLHYRLELLERRGLGPDRDLFIAEHVRRRQQLLAPKLTEPTEARCAAWSQPEAQAFWEAWVPPAQQEHDIPSFEAAKGVLLATALREAHLKAGRDALKSKPLLLETVTALARGTSRGEAIGDGLLPVREYSAITRLVKRVAPTAPILLQKLCVDVVRELAEMFPELPIGEYVSADAQKVAAWAVQKSGKVNGVLDPEREAYLRRRCPHAGFKSYGHDRDGVGDPGERTTIKDYDNWRGYLQLPVSDITCGVPIVGLLADSSTLHEPRALHELLRRLYGMWPDIPLQGVVGDKLYDEAEACVTCELDFGVASVFIRKPSHAETKREFEPDEHPTIETLDGWGVGVCREHNLPMRMESLARPDRTGLDPGERADASKLRYRFACTAVDEEPCGRPSLALTDPRVGALASALTRLPHHPNSGRAREYARRVALEGARNSASESAHGSLQCGYRLATEGPDRPRVYDLATLETLLWLAYATRALLVLLAHRMYHDEVRAHLEQLKRPVRPTTFTFAPHRVGRAA